MGLVDETDAAEIVNAYVPAGVPPPISGGCTEELPPPQPIKDACRNKTTAAKNGEGFLAKKLGPRTFRLFKSMAINRNTRSSKANK